MKDAWPLLLVCLLPLGVLGRQEARAGRTALVLTHVTVIDATGAPAKPDMTVVIKDGRIAALGKTANLDVPEDAHVVDATGKFLIPGLWDMHIHPWLGKNFLALFTANGVTGVRVMWGEPVHHKWRQEISAGKLIGPRMVIASPIVGSGPGDFPAGSEEDEGRQVVRKVKKEGADLVKVFDYMPRDAYFAIADEAKKQGIPLAGHVPFPVSAAEASDAGQQSIEHCPAVLLACSSEGEEELRKKTKETWDTGPISLSHERVLVKNHVKQLADITYSEKEAAELFARFVKNGTWVCPTLIVWHGLSFRDEEDLVNDPRLKHMPLSTKDSWNPKNDVRVAWATGGGRADFRKLCEKHLAIVGAMSRAGVGLLAGSDTTAMAYCFPGFGLHDELALFVQAGLSPMQALQTATYNPAKCLGKLDSMGTVERGKVADLVLLDADPLQDMRNTQEIAAVVVDGKIFDKTALQKMLAQVEDARLGQAAADGKIEQVKLLISEGADVNEKTTTGDTPLHYAAKYGHKNVAVLLIKKGADVNAKNKNGDLPTHLALRGHLESPKKEVLDLLVAKGPELSCIQISAYQGDLAKVRSFVEQGIDVDSRDSEGRTALYYAAMQGKRDLVEFLLSRGANVNAKDKDYGFTPLHHAVGGGHKDVVELLIAKGADVNATDKHGWTPLDSSVYGGNTDIPELLIEAGANVNSRYGWGQTPLIWAAQEGHTPVVQLLIVKGADFNAQDDQGLTPLHYAADEGHKDVAELLIAKGASVDATGKNDWTPLHRAARAGHRDVVEMLVKKGADVNAEDNQGRPALYHAKVKGYTELVELLRKHGAKE
jgi:ankyrin repeat protein